jgi:hypothetical protein
MFIADTRQQLQCQSRHRISLNIYHIGKETKSRRCIYVSIFLDPQDIGTSLELPEKPRLHRTNANHNSMDYVLVTKFLPAHDTTLLNFIETRSVVEIKHLLS